MSYLARGSKFRIQRRCQRSCRINKNLLKEAACIYNQYSINCYFFTTQVKYWEIKIINPHWVTKPEKKSIQDLKYKFKISIWKLHFIMPPTTYPWTLNLLLMVQNDHQKTALNLPIHFVPFTWSQFSKEINLMKHIKWSHMQECCHTWILLWNHENMTWGLMLFHSNPKTTQMNDQWTISKWLVAFSMAMIATLVPPHFPHFLWVGSRFRVWLGSF
jgi:hypothetical protein